MFLSIGSLAGVTSAMGGAPITVTGPGNGQIQNIKMVSNSIFNINSRINAADGGIGSVLALVVLILIARAAQHIFVKRPRRGYQKGLQQADR